MSHTRKVNTRKPAAARVAVEVAGADAYNHGQIKTHGIYTTHGRHEDDDEIARRMANKITQLQNLRQWSTHHHHPAPADAPTSWPRIEEVDE